ncbi:MAG: hypothetical protein KJ625_03495 [Actinobacteria bacterium]|nr:hypothetical protein [Actinomycetota bacterium]
MTPNTRHQIVVTGMVSRFSVLRSVDTVPHRERGAAPARRATESYSWSTSRERNAAGVDGSGVRMPAYLWTRVLRQELNL